MYRLIHSVFVIVIGALFFTTAVQSQTPERAVIAGTLIEDRDGDGTLSAADGGARTLVQLMQRSNDGGYICVDQQFSGSDGKFRFEDLSFSTYEVMVWWSPGFFDFDLPPDSGDQLTLAGSADDLRDGIETYLIRIKQKPEGLVPYPVTTGPRGAAVPCRGLNNPSKPQNICARTGPEEYEGWAELEHGNITVILPAPGSYRVWQSPPPSTPALIVCYVEGNSSVTFSLPGGRELSREVNSPEGAAVLDAIVASAHVSGQPERAEVPRPSVIRPPDTGDGGLR